MPRYRVQITHTITVVQEVVVNQPSFEDAEAAAACRWKKFPTTKHEKQCCTYKDIKFNVKKES